MTDHEKLTSLFTELGIPFTETRDGNIMIRVEAKGRFGLLDTVVLGYSGSSADFEFTSAGKFVNVGIWEE